MGALLTQPNSFLSPTGTINVSEPGFSGGILTTWTAVTATATLIPGTALTGRTTMLVQAWEGNTLPIFIGSGAITARALGATPGAADGIMLLAGQSIPVSAAAALGLYVRATSTGCYVGTCEMK